MAATAEATKRLRLDAIRTDGTQTRKFNPVVASEYAAAMSAGAKFPPVVVFYDGTDYWMSCGHHRLEASKIVEAKTIECDVRKGTQFEALCYAFLDNDKHGLRVTNEDKRFRTILALKRPECDGWSDSRIAKLVGVSHPFVGKIRAEVVTVTTSKPIPASPSPVSDQPLLPPEPTACPNCGGVEFTEHNDCAKCLHPCGEEVDEPDTDEADEEAEPKMRIGIDGKKYPAKKKKTAAPSFDLSTAVSNLFVYLRALAAKWPAEHSKALSQVLDQMSREAITISGGNGGASNSKAGNASGDAGSVV